MEQVERLEFISEDGDATFSTDDVTGAPPASVAAVDDPLYRATSTDPDSFDRESEPVGTVRATAIVGHDSRAVWNIVLDFFDGSTIVALGSLPVVSGRPGAGRVSVTGGSGRFTGLTGELEVRVKNPKRWTVS